MKYLSIFNEETAVRDFLSRNGFDSYPDAEDLFVLFECDPDFVDIRLPSGGYSRVFFAQYHPDYTYGGEQVVLTTAEDSFEYDAVKQFFEDDSDFKKYEPNTWESMQSDKESSLKVAYRGGMGYVYTLYYAV